MHKGDFSSRYIVIMNSVSTNSAVYYPEENAKLSARPVAEVKLKLAHHFCPNFLGSRWLAIHSFIRSRLTGRASRIPKLVTVSSCT